VREKRQKTQAADVEHKQHMAEAAAGQLFSI
jgi:hypothetical protein